MGDVDQVIEPYVFVHVHQVFPHHTGTALPNAPILSSTSGAVIARASELTQIVQLAMRRLFSEKLNIVVKAPQDRSTMV
jgi:hypothetical protein